MRTSSRAEGSRFAANSFQYNGRVALMLVPALIVLLDFGGTFVMGALVVRL